MTRHFFKFQIIYFFLKKRVLKKTVTINNYNPWQKKKYIK